ncbi:MAG: cation transporter [Candidatus Eremiobacteraeota bacterium]|nr:cation transporter [Candidatus Eremiobacteraeota bacterium]
MLRLPLATNALLVIAKLGVWFASGSVSVLSEAVHSGADLFMTIVQFFSIRAAAQPADHDHAYGHGKYENISAALQALFILAIAALVVVEAVIRLRSGATIAHLDLGIAVMVASGVLNIFVSGRLARAAEREHSPALAAQATELRADVWTAGGVAIILFAIKMTGLTILDPIFSLVVAGVIAHSAYDLTARAFVELTDQRLPPEDEAMIREIIERHKDIFVSYHKLRTRRSGGGEFIDFHLQMPGGIPLKQAHDRSDTIVSDIKQTMPLAHVLIHLEPAD